MNIYSRDVIYAEIEETVVKTGTKLLRQSLKREIAEAEREEAEGAAYSVFLDRTLDDRIAENQIVAADHVSACINAYVSAIRLSASRYDRSGLVFSDREGAARAAERGERYSRREFAIADIERQAENIYSDDDNSETEIDVAVCPRLSILERLCSADEIAADQQKQQGVIDAVTGAMGATVEQIVNDVSLLRQAVEIYNNGCKKLVSAAEAARMLGCSDRTLRNYVNRGVLKQASSTTGGRGVTAYYEHSAVAALIACR